MPDLGELHSFQKDWNSAESPSVQYAVLRRWWLKISKENLPKQHQSLVHSRIGYELQAMAYASASLPLPAPALRNLEALRAWSVGLMTDNVRRMLRIEMQGKPPIIGDEDMAKKAVGSSSKAKKSVNQFYLEIFEGQAKAQLTDSQIQSAIKAKTGSEPTFKNIASYRNAYNNAKLRGQKSCPVKVRAVRPHKEKAKRPMSAETKAKLKAYTKTKKKSEAGK